MTRRPVLADERIYLREVTPADVNETYLGWLNDPDVNRFLETRFVDQSLDRIADFVRRMRQAEDTTLFAICLRNGDTHIGNIKIGPVNPHHLQADVSLFIGEKTHWGRGLGAEAIRTVTAHGFRDLGLNKLSAGAYAANTSSIKAFEASGWRREGELKNHYIFEGAPMDIVILGLCARHYGSGANQ